MKRSHDSGERAKLPRILAVDDRQANLVCLQLVLEPEGYEVVTETCGYRALSLCASTTFDLILLDVMMPGIDGIDVATRLRADPQTMKVPIVFVTAVPEAATRATIDGSPIVVLAKPLDLVILRTTVAGHIGRRPGAKATTG